MHVIACGAERAPLAVALLGLFGCFQDLQLGSRVQRFDQIGRNPISYQCEEVDGDSITCTKPFIDIAVSPHSGFHSELVHPAINGPVAEAS